MNIEENIRAMDYKFLGDIMLRWSDSELYKEGNIWIACTEWLLGTFAGRAFEGATKRQALKKMCDYFDAEIGRDTIVGKTLSEMGWPNLDLIYQKIFIEGE